MNKYDRLILVCAGIAVSSSVSAQEHRNDTTVNRTVVVENQYNPEVMDAFKVNVLPKIEEPAVAKKQIDYATEGHLLSRFSVQPMDAITRDIEQKKARRGYLRASYGNRNNTDVKGAYLWNITDRDCLDVMASFYGFSGDMYGYDIDDNTGIPEINEEKEWKHKFFRTDVSLDYSHAFDKVKLSLGGAFASQSFKYMPDIKLQDNGDGMSASSRGTQSLNMGEGFIGVSSVEGATPLEFGLRTGFRFFKHDGILPLSVGISEKVIHTKGYLYGNLSEEQMVGADLSMDNVMYDNVLKNFSLIRLNPNYRLVSGGLKLSAGVNLDLQTGYSSGFKVSPDVRLDYNFAGSFVLYAGVNGGTKLNDFRALNGVSPYWLPSCQTKTSYTPYDASIGLKGSPANGFGLNLYGGYKEVKDELFSLPYAMDGVVINSFSQSKAKVAYAALGIDYAYRDFIDLGFDLGYQNWKAKEGNDALLWLKPEFYIDAKARLRIFEGLHASLRYLYEGRVSTLGKRAKAVNDLSLNSDYNFNDRFNVFLGLNNLMNSKYITETGYPIQGFNIMAGVSLNF